MALSLNQTEAVGRLVKPGMRVASMGYPDVIAEIDLKGLEYREDSEAICKRHGLKQRPIPDAHSFFKLMGAELDVYDIVKERGCEIILDLNERGIPAHQYDIVLDVGTAEHCFNIGQALINMGSMVKEGGYIIHENPSNWGNHGFYNLNPTLFYDFYTDNGFEVEELKLVTRDGCEAKPPPTQRFKFSPEELNIFCLARRVMVQSFIYPTQTKYKQLLTPGNPGERAASERAKEVVNG
jgi:hypothetical protein